MIIRYCWLLLFCAASFRASFGQPAVSQNDQYRQISRLMAQQNYERAIAESKTLIEQSPNYYNAYVGLVIASNQADQLEQTRGWLESLLARGQSQPMAYVGLALIREVKGDFAGAIENYLKCLRELPDDGRVAALMATDYVNQKKGEEGETFFKSLLTTQPDSVAGHYGLGVLYLHVGTPQGGTDRTRSSHSPATREHFCLLLQGICAGVRRPVMLKQSRRSKAVCAFWKQVLTTDYIELC